MAVLSKPNFAVLYFNPTAWPHKVAKNKFLLWPAYGFRIAAPIPRNRSINLFQKSILAMLQADVEDHIEIGKLLNLSPELIRYILQELSEMGLVACGKLTGTGKEFLQQASLGDQTLVSGYIFQDPFTGKFWPRFIEHLEFADLEYDEKQRVYLLFGSSSNPRRERAFRVLSEKNICFPPRSDEIITICSKHWQEVRRYQKLRAIETGEINIPLIEPIQFTQVALISKQPTAFFLSTYFYLPQHTTSTEMWQVCDPFGLGASSWFRDTITKQSMSDENLRNYIQDILSDAPPVNKEYVDMLSHNYQKAVERVQKQLTHSDLIPEGILNAMADMEVLAEEIRTTESHVALGRIKDTISKFQVVLAQVFQYIQTKFPVQQQWMQQFFTSYDIEYNTLIFKQIVKKLGFQLPNNDQQPECLRYIKLPLLQQVCEDSTSEVLSAQIITNVVAAQYEEQHPLCLAAKKYPRLLLDIAAILEWHLPLAQLSAKHPTAAQILDQVQMVYQIVKILIVTNGQENVLS